MIRNQINQRFITENFNDKMDESEDIVIDNIISSISKIYIDKKKPKDKRGLGIYRKLNIKKKIDKRKIKKYTIPIILYKKYAKDVKTINIELHIYTWKTDTYHVKFIWWFRVDFVDGKYLFVDIKNIEKYVYDNYAIKKIELLEQCFNEYYLSQDPLLFNPFRLVPLYIYETEDGLKITSTKDIHIHFKDKKIG